MKGAADLQDDDFVDDPLHRQGYCPLHYLLISFFFIYIHLAQYKEREREIEHAKSQDKHSAQGRRKEDEIEFLKYVPKNPPRLMDVSLTPPPFLDL